MKHVDHMIKYLSGDLSAEESLAFETELKGNPQFEEEFSRVSYAYNTISDQLKNRDEAAFSSALNTAMKQADSDETPKKHTPVRWWYIIMAVAASLAILLTFTGPGRNNEKIYAFWYKPSLDPVILAIREETRGESDKGTITLWIEGDYQQCREQMAGRLSEDPADHFALLFFLLSSMEMDETDKVLDRVESAGSGTSTTLGQAIIWYHALALIKAEDASRAADLLTSLAELPGPYQEDAHKLKKKLKK